MSVGAKAMSVGVKAMSVGVKAMSVRVKFMLVKVISCGSCGCHILKIHSTLHKQLRFVQLLATPLSSTK